ncbi:MAG: hypothetical protein ACFFAS_18110 [Promethearchaeota archaeon]
MKYSSVVQDEIQRVMERLQVWKNLFFFSITFYYEGWSISLKEKNIYPRLIIIFKSFDDKSYSIKSFEIHNNSKEKEEYKELYFINNLPGQESLLKEVREIINGKDLVSCARNKLQD